MNSIAPSNDGYYGQPGMHGLVCCTLFLLFYLHSYGCRTFITQLNHIEVKTTVNFLVNIFGVSGRLVVPNCLLSARKAALFELKIVYVFNPMWKWIVMGIGHNTRVNPNL